MISFLYLLFMSFIADKSVVRQPVPVDGRCVLPSPLPSQSSNSQERTDSCTDHMCRILGVLRTNILGTASMWSVKKRARYAHFLPCDRSIR